jgi:hypothetical protein
LDLARHYGFSIYPCTPGRANEKGRVERVIRDIGLFVTTDTFRDMDELNRSLTAWRRERNLRVHRSTGKPPCDMLKEETLTPLPQVPYQAYRMKTAMVSPTGFVSFDTNRYSVPSPYSHQPCSLKITPGHLEVIVNHRKVATHQRSFLTHQTIEHPSHRERLLAMTPHFKYQRIFQLMTRMDKEVALFLKRAEGEGEDPLAAAYDLFTLLRGISKHTLLSAVREANKLGTFKVAYIKNLLQPAGTKDAPVYPQDATLLAITYERSDLARYDELI